MCERWEITPFIKLDSFLKFWRPVRHRRQAKDWCSRRGSGGRVPCLQREKAGARAVVEAEGHRFEVTAGAG